MRLEPARQPDKPYWLRTISLNIEAPCNYYVDGKSIFQEKLIEELNVAQGTDMQRVRVLIKPDLDVQYSEVARTIDRLHEAGYIKIGLISADKE
ncbi:ExbD/TolR family protein [Asticcacaulis benevestitus]|uniref:ExbD/TolR family protein n=1 Tax=Asticcacaulis benevestitus TaxID=347481 RepID=UPI0012F9121C|nr:biopolymer transporter ExbD [Asticcacaulis benevestitus]